MQQVLAEINRQKYPCTHLKFLKDGFEGVYLLTEADTLHFTFGVPAPINEYQMTIVFHDTFCDVLAFPHPTIILPDYIQASEQVTNCINGYVKIPDSSGKFYVDEEYLDFVYSARISYRYLEAFPDLAIKDGAFGYLPFMADVGNFVFQVAQGQMPAEEACQHIVSLWGVES